jgi:branched-chain amino acid transport system permease protein
MMKTSTSGKPSILKPSWRWLTPGAIVALLVVAILVPQLKGADNIWNLFFMMALGVAMGQSWNMLGGFAGQILWFRGVPFVLAFVVAGVVAVAFAMIIGAPTFRLRGAYFAIGTLAVAEVLRITISQNQPYISTMSGKMIASYNLPERYWATLALAIGTSMAAYMLLRSRWSLGILGVREDEEAAQATGVHVLRHKLLALGLSALVLGFAGALFAYQGISYYPEAPFSPTFTFQALMIAYIGGLGTVAGPIIGGIFFVLVRERLATTLPEWHQIIFGVLFVIVVLLLPGGLMEIWERAKRFVARRILRRDQRASKDPPTP